MIVLQETSYSEQDYMHLYPTFIFLLSFRISFNPFPKSFTPFLK